MKDAGLIASVQFMYLIASILNKGDRENNKCMLHESTYLGSVLNEMQSGSVFRILF